MNKVSVSEMSESINGFDEIAIERVMGIDMYTQSEQKPMMMMRSLAFVAFRRDGATDAEARDKALSLSVKEMNEFFAEEVEEIDESEPETPEGKEDSQPA